MNEHGYNGIFCWHEYSGRQTHSKTFRFSQLHSYSRDLVCQGLTEPAVLSTDKVSAYVLLLIIVISISYHVNLSPYNMTDSILQIH